MICGNTFRFTPPAMARSSEGKAFRSWASCRQGEPCSRLLIVRGVQAKQVAAKPNQRVGAFKRIGQLHHIDHDLSIMFFCAYKGALNGLVAANAHDGDDIRARAKSDTGFRFAGIHDLEIGQQARLWVSSSNFAHGSHTFTENKRCADLNDIDIRMRLFQHSKSARQVSIESKL